MTRSDRRYDVEWVCEGNSFFRTNLTREEAQARMAELKADSLVTEVNVSESN
jgi:hypothetical protein